MPFAPTPPPIRRMAGFLSVALDSDSARRSRCGCALGRGPSWLPLLQPRCFRWRCGRPIRPPVPPISRLQDLSFFLFSPLDRTTSSSYLSSCGSCLCDWQRAVTSRLSAKRARCHDAMRSVQEPRTKVTSLGKRSPEHSQLPTGMHLEVFDLAMHGHATHLPGSFGELTVP